MTQKPISDSDIFRAAAKLAPNQRSAYLEEVCGDNRPLRAEVESLLRAHDPDGSFLDSPAIAATINQPNSERPGSIIGPYKLREQIGEGGFGVVYVAEQEHPVRRKVALKVIKPGMDSKDVIARFEAERQALALMDHPNVARVLDAGTTQTGRPYFVMELVQGVNLTEYCDRNNLSTRERLALFVDVCRAVQHAHQKGIIHRDIKPSNIMVTLHDGRPVVKVIDFGVSKALSQRLTEKSIYTAYGQMIGTPAYMSPEQAEMSGLGIDTRSDIYSLGVLLYELLTGQTPLDAKRLRSSAYAEILRIIREEEPPRPSFKISTLGEQATMVARHRSTAPEQLRRDLSGELDWIVMTCLEKDRSRRYETATGLARDIERYLRDEPVEACPPSGLYRLRKFTRKHRVMIGSVSAFTALLIIGSVVSGWLALSESRANHNAQTARADAERSLAEEQRQRNLANQREVEAQTAREELRATLYAANMNLIQSAWDNQQYEQVDLLLTSEVPTENSDDLRGWEWYYWRQKLDQGLIQTVHLSSVNKETRFDISTFLASHGSQIVRFEYPKPANLASWEVERVGPLDVAIYDRRTQQELLRFVPFPEATGPFHWHIFYSDPDGSRFVIYLECDQRWLAIFDARSGRKIRDLPVPARPSFLDFDQEGKRFAALFPNPSADGEYSPADADSTRSSSTARIWDVDSGDVVYEQEFSSVEDELTIALSPDGTQLLICHEGSHDAEPWQLIALTTGTVVWEHPCLGHSLAFKWWPCEAPLLAVANEGTANQGISTLELWDVSTGQLFATMPRPRSRIWGDVAISPNGKKLAELGNHQILLFDIPRAEKSRDHSPILLVPPSLSIPDRGMDFSELVFSADSSELVCRNYGSVLAWKLDQGSQVTSSPLDAHSGASARFNFDASQFAFLSKDQSSVQICDSRTGACIRRCELGQELEFVSPPLAYLQIQFSADGQRLLTIYGKPQNGEEPVETSIWVHEIATGKPLWDTTQNVNRNHVALHPYKNQVLTLELQSNSKESSSTTVKLWDLESGTVIAATELDASFMHGSFDALGEEIHLLAIERDESRASTKLSTGSSGYRFEELSTDIRILAADSLSPIRSLTPMEGAAILYRSEKIILRLDRDLSIRSGLDGVEQIRLQNVSGVLKFAFNSDGTRLALGKSGDNNGLQDISIWSAQSGRRLLTIPLAGNVVDLAFSKDGDRLMAIHWNLKFQGLSLTTWEINHDPPFTPAALRRNEILVRLKDEGGRQNENQSSPAE